MKTALIGYTGFVGSNIAKQYKFTDLYNSENISKINGKKYDLIVSAGTKAERWKANQNPKEDWKGIKNLLDNLENVKVKHFVLISTVDVYPYPNEVDEDIVIKISDFKQAYGLNRFKMENFVRKNFPKVTVVRLPQTFGTGLKKNFIYDLIHGNALDFTHKDSLLQFYNLNNLWKDIKNAIKNNISVLNLAVEPIKASELARHSLGIVFKNKTTSPPFVYNVITKYGRYLYKKSEVLKEIKKFITQERAKTKISISNLAWNKDEENNVIKILKKYQIAGVELAISKIWGDPKKWKESGIQIVATTSLLYGHPELTIFGDEKTRKKTLEYLKKMIKLTSDLGTKVMIFGSPKNRLIGKLNKNEADKIAIDFFRKIGKEAKKYKITFCIEPVPTVYGSDFILNTKEARDLVKKIGSDNIKINMDTGAMKINKEDFKKEIKKSLNLIGHLHVSEQGFAKVSDTRFGHKIIAKTLKNLKYKNWVSIEMWAKEGQDNTIQIEKSLKFVKKIYE